MLNFLINKMQNKEPGQMGWNMLFFVLKYIQSVALVALFISGSNSLNHLRNLGFMFFFVTYTSSEYLYRKTSKCLIIFVAFFLGGQYYFSLVYRNYIDDKTTWNQLEWMNLFEESKKPKWVPGDSIYFRHTPYPFDWVVLFIMCVLNFINAVIFNDNEIANLLSKKCYENIRDMYTEEVFFLQSIKNAMSRYFMALTIIIMFLIIGFSQTNLINWGYFILLIANFAFIVKADNKDSTNKHSCRIASTIKLYSAFFLLFDIFFIVFIGEEEKVDQPDSLDQIFKGNYPILYDNLDTIGLRVWVNPSEGELSPEKIGMLLKYKFYSYIASLMISLYWVSYFESKLKKNKGLDQFAEKDF
jgi:hypothetical protein